MPSLQMFHFYWPFSDATNDGNDQHHVSSLLAAKVTIIFLLHLISSLILDILVFLMLILQYCNLFCVSTL